MRVPGDKTESCKALLLSERCERSKLRRISNLSIEESLPGIMEDPDNKLSAHCGLVAIPGIGPSVHAYKVKHYLPSIDTNRPNLHWNTSCPHLYTKGLRRRTMPVVLGQSSIVTTDPYFGNGRGFWRH